MPDSANEDSMTTTLRPAEQLGDVLTGRDSAADLRHEVERRLAAGQRVVLDFTDVAILSPSFADELLAKLPADALDTGRVAVEHLDSASAALARVAIASRR
jgi:hypothetical protein